MFYPAKDSERDLGDVEQNIATVNKIVVMSSVWSVLLYNSK